MITDRIVLWLYPIVNSEWFFKKALEAYNRETVRLYNVRFAARVRDVRAEFAQAGVVDAELDRAISDNDFAATSERLAVLAGAVE